MTLSVKQLQKKYGVGEHTVLGWIRTGELRAINVSRSGSSRPKWRISEEALKAFEEHRSAVKQPQPHVHRKRSTDDVTEFIK